MTLPISTEIHERLVLDRQPGKPYTLVSLFISSPDMQVGLEARLRKLEAVNDSAVLIIAGHDFTECRLRADALEAAGKLAGRASRYVVTGVHRSDGF